MQAQATHAGNPVTTRRFVQVIPEALDALAQEHDLDHLDLALLRALIESADYRTGQILGTSLLDLADLVRLRCSEGHARRVVRRALCRLATAELIIEAPAVRVTRAGTTRRTGLINIEVVCRAEVVRGGRTASRRADDQTPEALLTGPPVESDEVPEIEAPEVVVPSEIEAEIEALDPRTHARHPRTHARGTRTGARSTRHNAPLDREIDRSSPTPPDDHDRVREVVGRIEDQHRRNIKISTGLRAAVTAALDAGWEPDDLADRAGRLSLDDALDLAAVLTHRVRALGEPAPVPERTAPPFVKPCTACGARTQWDCYCPPVEEPEQGAEHPRSAR
jgi:hypothetical protein